jgi:hypothetical protein
MLTNLKKNHRYVFYKKLPNSKEIKEFRAIVISVSNNTLLVHSYESEDQLYHCHSKHCVWSIPSKWIIKFEVSDEDIAIDHNDIFTELIVLD